MEGQIVTSMRHGQVWTNTLVRREFPSIDSNDARRALRHLVEMHFAETIGERGGLQYRLDPRWGLSASSAGPKVSVSEPARPAAQDPLPDLLAPAAPVPAQGPAQPAEPGRRGSSPVTVLAALSRGQLSAREISAQTGLSINSVRNALRRLISEGSVQVKGGWGVKGTTYELAGSG